MHLTSEQQSELLAVNRLTPDELDRSCAERMGWRFANASDGYPRIFNPGGQHARDYPHPTRDRADAWDLLHFAMAHVGEVLMLVENDTYRHVRMAGWAPNTSVRDDTTGMDRDPKIALCRAVLLAGLWRRFYEEHRARKDAENMPEGGG